MTHQPPLPEAAISPYPVSHEPMPESDNPLTVAQNAKADEDRRRKRDRDRWIAAGVATAGIGSAAIVAALLYTNRGKDKKPGKA